MLIRAILFALAFEAAIVCAASAGGYEPGPLRKAVQSGNLEEVRRLLREKPGQIDEVYFGVPLIMETSDPRMLKVLLSFHPDLRKRDSQAMTGLDRAILNGDLAVVKLFAPSKELVNARDALGRSPLVWAVGSRGDRVALIEYLISRGANPNDDGALHDTASLETAVISKDTSSVEALIRGGADVNIAGGRPLFSAAANRNVGMMDLLLKHGAKINQSTRYSGSPLLYVVAGPHHIDTAPSAEEKTQYEKDYFPIVKYLVEHGSDVNAEENWYSALGMSEHQGYASISAYLKSHGAKTSKWNYR